MRLPKNGPAVVRFVGKGGTPQVRLHGPGGRVIETPGAGVGHLTDNTSYVSFRDEAHGVADVLLRNAGSGAWTYELMPGSPAVASVQTAGQLPKPQVRAKVAREFVTRTITKVRGKRPAKPRRRATGRYVLSWNLRRIPGQQVVLSEQGLGVPPRVLLRTNKAKGSFAFRPQLLPQRGRRIVATVEQYGRPRARIPVARYTAPILPKAVRVTNLRAKRRGGRVIVTWKRLPGAGTYRTFTIERNGRKTFRSVKKPRLVLRGRQARSFSAAIVQPVGVDLELGKRSRVTLKSGKAKKPAKAKGKTRKRPAARR